MAATLGELAVRHGCELRGDPDVRVERVGTLAGAGPEALTFFANPRLRRELAATRAAAVLVAPAAAASVPVAALVVANPHATFARIAAELHPAAIARPGLHPSAVIAADARLAASVHVEIGRAHV